MLSLAGKGYILKQRATRMERKDVAKPWRALAVIPNNTSWGRGTPFYPGRNMMEQMLRKNCWCLCYRDRLEPGGAEEHCNKFSLKSTPIVLTIHLGFAILCSVYRILSKIWNNNGKVMGKLKYIMKASETCTDFQHSNVGAVICIDSSFKYN